MSTQAGIETVTAHPPPTGAFTSDPCVATNINSVYETYCSSSFESIFPSDCSDSDFACCTSTYNAFSAQESCISVHASFSCDGYVFVTTGGDSCSSGTSSPSPTTMASVTELPSSTTSSTVTATNSGTVPEVTQKSTSGVSSTKTTTQSTVSGSATPRKASAGNIERKVSTSAAVMLGIVVAMLFFQAGI